MTALGLIASLGLNYVEVGLDPDGLWWTLARLLALAVLVLGAVAWFFTGRQEKQR